MATRTATAISKKAQVAEIKPLELRGQTEVPDVNTLRKAIPAHCFEQSTATSLGYVARDLMLSGSLWYLAVTSIPQIHNVWARAAAWATYTFVQGLVCTGIWILGHECGHGAFSPNQKLNDVVGWALHSLLSVPYFSWKYSHHRHHNNTGHMGKDMVFVPHTKEDYDNRRKFISNFIDPDVFDDTPALALVRLVSHQLLGWPSYLLFNFSHGPDSMQRPKEQRWFRMSHFDPFSVVFRPSEALYVFLSDVGLVLTWTALYFAAQRLDVGTIVLLYVLPWAWVHHWLIAITYLHHNHPDVKHYDENGWSYVKGALGTIDRDFGLIDRHLFHGIIGTHVVHHLFARIPFYHAEEATAAIKPLLGEHYHEDKRSFYGQLWSVFNNCRYVERDPTEPGAMIWAKEY